MKSEYVKINPSEVVASAILWEQIPDALKEHAKLHLDWLSGRRKKYQLRQSHDAFEVN